jgi:hypothetical protein
MLYIVKLHCILQEATTYLLHYKIKNLSISIFMIGNFWAFKGFVEFSGVFLFQEASEVRRAYKLVRM